MAIIFGSSVQVQSYRIDSFSVSAHISLVNGASWWHTGTPHTSVYGPTQEGDKIVFLDELRSVRASCPGQWVLTGDFNLIVDATGKNNENLNRRMMGRFR